jgi:transcriptional regulator with XRE-family HTH domain
MTTGDRIAQARTERGLTQAELAQQTDCTASAVQKWEAGTIIPRTNRLRAIATATDKPLSFFLGDEPAGAASHSPDLAAELARLNEQIARITGQPPPTEPPRPGAEEPGIVALLNDTDLCDKLNVTEWDRRQLLGGWSFPEGIDTAEDAIILLNAIRAIRARRQR